MTLEPPPDHPTAETTAYRRALGAFATGVCVVTADSAQGPLGLTINSFTSVSLKPRLILWCLDERSERWPAFAAADRFAVHVLSAADRPRAARFARGVALLSEGEFERQADGAPCLPDALARFDCAAHDRIRMGDHMIIVGRVEDFAVGEGPALTYWRGRYGAMGEGE
ncbi:flavin reductase family protein [Brevundimonas viscosa]|uniref:NADH-FMN oxidoreductase RutF, flavin reductase (DIM6/NTAB) family n=1 Tax=Brevundimonas viscosa TaxID=871741 RepID=A0A1I6Q1K1_9CAUL|nr:flavin reductase family protein [Brevundimonas viscosa]SFS46336.1 NADH-FMN oxidoreductase RutF, flavin reductase (DIM6/NTAB) family [Brevundimonas viscosa]